MSDRHVVVFGPAYLDRVLRVDRPLVESDQGPPLDQSVEGRWEFGDGFGIAIVDSVGFRLEIAPPPGWPGPRGKVRLEGPIRRGMTGQAVVRGIAWSDDLGGMGAGYARALDGELHSALGSEADPTSQAISERILRYGLDHHPIRVPDRAADWTLLVSSGEFGDKLPIGFRGCHAAIDIGELSRRAAGPADLLVVAALPNRLAEAILRRTGAPTRFFAPALRNMADRVHPVVGFGACIDILSCNRAEWETLAEREAVAAAIPILAVTDGPRGSEIRFTDLRGESGLIRQPTFPRTRPPRDTNRAGEAFASMLVSTLLAHGWTGADPRVDDGLVRMAARRAAASAALVLDRLDFGFPSADEVDSALRAGRVV